MASIVIAGDVSGTCTISAPSAAGTPTLTLPTTSGTLVVTGGAQTVQFAAGSAASPSITFTGDTNTGIFSPAADTIAFSEGGTESIRIDSSGNLLVGASSLQTFSGVTADHALVGTTGNGRWVTGFRNNGNSNPWGLAIGYSAASPNNTTQAFLWAEDSSGLRFNVRSNGGIGNYQANDANLSDEREKTNIELAADYLDKICAIPVKTFNYIDQNFEEDDGLTLGVIAQDVQKVAPELISESNCGTEDKPKMRLAIYQTDLQYALMKAIQELNAKVEAQAAEIAQLKGAK
jgi:hypothetical protein